MGRGKLHRAAQREHWLDHRQHRNLSHGHCAHDAAAIITRTPFVTTLATGAILSSSNTSGYAASTASASIITTTVAASLAAVAGTTHGASGASAAALTTS